MSAKVVVFFSIKGGVGKTTSCSNIAVALSKMKIKTLIIDMDPIGSLSANFLLTNVNGSMNLIDDKKDVKKSISKNVINSLDVIPTSLDLSFRFMDGDISKYEDNYKKSIDELRKHYDIILIDISSNWNSLNRMVLTNADSVLLPIICTPFAIDAISKALVIIRTIQIERNANLKIEGAFINMFDKRKTDSVTYLSDMTKIFESDLYDTIIPNDSAILKLQKDNKIIVNSQSWSPSAIKFSELANEIYKKMMKR